MFPEFKSRQGQLGLGLPATIFIITVLAMIVVALGELTRGSSQAFAQNFQSQRAFYAAESGAQIALNRVFTGGSACGSLSDISFGSNQGLENCSASLSCSQVVVDSVTYYTFQSTGTCGTGLDEASRMIEVRAHE